ncbi:MAG: agmatinase [Actinomycetota bacterium]
MDDANAPTDDASRLDRPDRPAGEQAFRRGDLDRLGRWPEMTYGGATSFLRRNYSRDLDGVDVAVSGICFDAATSGRPGARLGPRAIREASVEISSLPAYPFGFDPFDTLSVVDYGDVYLDFGRPTDVVERVVDHARDILSTDTSMVTFGGDHFVTYPLLRAHAEKYGPLALVHFDAHSDTWPDDGDRLDHGSMFLRAMRENLIDPARSVQIGLRTYNDAGDHGFTILGAPWVHRNGIDAVLEVIDEVVGGSQAYLTFDIDCLDPAFAPGTGTPVAGGLTTAQALDAIRGLAPLDVVGMDVVEVSPPYDHAEVTALAAATIAHDHLCVLAEKKGAVRTPYGRA